MKRTTLFITIICCFFQLACQNKRIFEIQGKGRSSPFHGSTVTTIGVVTGDFQDDQELRGFFIQDTTGDNDPSTSDGIFVYDNLFGINVNVGDLVEISGEVDEYFGLTEIKNITHISVVGTQYGIAPTELNLPLPAVDSFERYEGMLIHLPQTLMVTENFNLGRYGELMLAYNGRLPNPTSIVDPNDTNSSGTTSFGRHNVAAVNDLKDINLRSSIVLDDGSSKSNPPTVPHINGNNTLRCGSTIDNITGVLSFTFGMFKVHPTSNPIFSFSPRPSVPTIGNNDLKIASFNVLNYFNGNGMGGGFPTSRGADTYSELQRQEAKIVSALKAIDADIVGLIEIENDGDNQHSAISNLVDALNTSLGALTYQYILDPNGVQGNTGSDAIKVALMYKTTVVTPVGPAYGDTDPIHSRAPLAQTFLFNGEVFTVIVNHFKSKGCSGATGLDEDQNDGQSCYNHKRKLQAGALLHFIEELQAISGDPDILIIGDLNAYQEEDPVDTLRNYGLIHLNSSDYSYVYQGEVGSLDHAFATQSLSANVTSVNVWHINADEPRMIDYNEEFNPPAFYDTSPFRCSDHDPVIIALDFSVSGYPGNSEQTVEMSLSPNPADDFIQINSKSPGSYDVEIFDTLGNSVLQKQLSGETATLNIAFLQKGTYIFKLVTRNKSVSYIEKITIQ